MDGAALRGGARPGGQTLDRQLELCSAAKPPMCHRSARFCGWTDEAFSDAALQLGRGEETRVNGSRHRLLGSDFEPLAGGTGALG